MKLVRTNMMDMMMYMPRMCMMMRARNSSLSAS